MAMERLASFYVTKRNQYRALRVELTEIPGLIWGKHDKVCTVVKGCYSYKTIAAIVKGYKAMLLLEKKVISAHKKKDISL